MFERRFTEMDFKPNLCSNRSQGRPVPLPDG